MSRIDDAEAELDVLKTQLAGVKKYLAEVVEPKLASYDQLLYRLRVAEEALKIHAPNGTPPVYERLECLEAALDASNDRKQIILGGLDLRVKRIEKNATSR